MERWKDMRRLGPWRETTFHLSIVPSVRQKGFASSINMIGMSSSTA